VEHRGWHVPHRLIVFVVRIKVVIVVVRRGRHGILSGRAGAVSGTRRGRRGRVGGPDAPTKRRHPRVQVGLNVAEPSVCVHARDGL